MMRIAPINRTPKTTVRATADMSSDNLATLQKKLQAILEESTRKMRQAVNVKERSEFIHYEEDFFFFAKSC